MAKYDPLLDHLRSVPDKPIELTFGEIDALVGGLPESAYRYRAWWSNEAPGGTHVQARAWMDASRRVEWVDEQAGTVRFSARGA